MFYITPNWLPESPVVLPNYRALTAEADGVLRLYRDGGVTPFNSAELSLSERRLATDYTPHTMALIALAGDDLVRAFEVTKGGHIRVVIRDRCYFLSPLFDEFRRSHETFYGVALRDQADNIQVPSRTVSQVIHQWHERDEKSGLHRHHSTLERNPEHGEYEALAKIHGALTLLRLEMPLEAYARIP